MWRVNQDIESGGWYIWRIIDYTKPIERNNIERLLGEYISREFAQKMADALNGKEKRPARRQP